MARLREGQLLIRPHVLARAGVLFALAATAAAGEAAPRAPAFFERPDASTRAEIESALEDLGQNRQLSDHTRGREALLRIGYWAVEPLLGLLRDGDGSEERNSALVLGELLDRRAVPALLRVAEEANHQYVGPFSILALGRFRDPDHLPLLDKLSREDRDRRIASVIAIIKIGGPEAVKLLREIYRTEKLSVVQAAAVFGLGFHRDAMLVATPEGYRPAPDLAAALKSSETVIRRVAALAVALLGHRDLKDVLWALAANTREDGGVRATALLGLGRFPDEDVTRLLLDVIVRKTEPDAVRVMAAFLLKDRRDPAALATLKHVALRLTDTQLRAVMVLALSNFEDPEVVELLGRALLDPKDQVRAAAAIGLSRMTDAALRARGVQIFDHLLSGAAGTIHRDVLHNMRAARSILKGEKDPAPFLWLGNEKFAEDLPKDVEEKLLDLVNFEAWHALGLTGLTALKAMSGPQRPDDEKSELRDLMDHLERHPYFGPEDVPIPELAITPRGGR